MKKISILFLLLFGMLGSLVYILYTMMYAGGTIKKIEIVSQYPIVFENQEVVGENIYILNEKKLRNHLLMKNAQAREITIEKIYPDTLRFTVEERVPFARIIPSETPKYIDEEGQMLTPATASSSLPLIEAVGIPLYFTSSPDWRLVKAAKYIKLFRKVSVEIAHISFISDGSYFFFRTGDNISVIVPYSSDPGTMSASLQLILSRFRIEKKPILRVDFRFEKPIITFQTEKKISSTIL